MDSERQRHVLRGPLFAGLNDETLDDICASAQLRHVAAGQLICREGEPSDSLFVLCDGVARACVTLPATETVTTVARLRPGSIVGEVGLITSQPRSASVIAQSDVTVMELTRDHFAQIVARHPQVLSNLAQLIGTRLAQRNVDLRRQAAAEVVVLAVETRLAGAALQVLAAARRASRHAVAIADLLPEHAHAAIAAHGLLDVHRPGSVLELMDRVEELCGTQGIMVVAVVHDDERIKVLLKHADRVLAVLGRETTLAFAPALRASAQKADLVLLDDDAPDKPLASDEFRVVRRCAAELGAADAAWVGRHLARTKLGLALGAGGAKAFAHAAVIEVLEDAGYCIDYLAGSSMGAAVAVWRALGMSGPEIAATLRTRCGPREIVDAIFRQGATGTGAEVFTRIFRETTGDRTFADLLTPTTVMTADLAARGPAPITAGPLWEALMAAVSIPGLYPPWVRGDQQLVDAVSLTPIPLDAIFEAGADVTIAVNLLGRELPSWPRGDAVAPPRTPRSPRDTVVQVLELAQLGASAREVARADVPITPRFGPGTWRQMELEELFFAAGKEAIEAQLPLLSRLVPPTRSPA